MATKLSDLPKDLLSSICEKLVHVDDYARFGAVCKSWRTIVWQTSTKIPPQLPMLIFPLSSYISSTYMHTHSFYTFSMNREVIKEVPLETTLFKNCYGSSHGWLIALPYYKRIQLLNLFRMDNNVINLPSLNLEEDRFAISRVVLSHNATWTSDYVVMVIYYYSCSMLAFLKPGDKYWTHVTDQEVKDLILNDIICYRDGFYAISLYGELVFFDISSTKPRYQRVAAAISKIGKGKYIISEGYVYTRMSLVELSGDLLCVVRWYSQNNRVTSTIGFQIFKLDTKGWEWNEVKTLQGCALFLDDSFSSSVLASAFNHCRPNHIYFTNQSSQYKFAMGVFNLEDSSLEILFSKNTKEDAIRPVWVQPTLNMMN